MGFARNLFLILVAIGAVVAYPGFLMVTSYVDDLKIESPLPDIFTNSLPSVLGYDDMWKPIENKVTNSKIAKPHITGKGVLSYDLSSDSILYEKNAKTRMPMASLTKIMTAVVALENANINDEYVVSKKAAEIGENSMGLSEGEKVSLEDLLYGLILMSGNDAAEVIAENSRYGRDNFVYLMNKKAEDMGLLNTRFTNPSGLEGDGQQYTTAYDLLVMTRYALAIPEFAKIAATVTHEIPYTDDHKAFYLYNETNLLTSYPGVKGVKTGYTYEAGLCLVTYLELDDRKIIAILLNAQNRRQEMKDILDYSLKMLGETPPSHE